MNPLATPTTSLTWIKARKSMDGGACVELSTFNGEVLIRDSKSPERGYLSYTAAEWEAFLDGAKKGEFDDLL